MKTEHRPSNSVSNFVENRRCSRYKLEVPIEIYPRNHTVIRSHTRDISESGISAMLLDDVPLGEVVRLEFALPFGKVEILAVARQRNAFRYGFEFLEDAAARELIARTCRELAVEEALYGKHDI